MQFIQFVIESTKFRNFIIFIIVFNAITIGIQTNKEIEQHYSAILEQLDTIFLSIFIIEFLMKVLVYRTKILKRNWDLFDFLIISTALLPNNAAFSVFRLLRILRVLRLISNIPKLRMVIQALMSTLSSISSIAILLGLIYYIYAVITTNFYGVDFPEFFGTLGKSFYTLFQIMTFESWSTAVVRPVMELHPNAWIVFVSFLVLTTYVALNLIIGIVVDCISDIKQNQIETNTREKKAEEIQLSEKLDSIEKQLMKLKVLLDK